MKLKTYIFDIRKISIAEAARELDEETETVRLWAEELRIPRRAGMKKVKKWSSGMVQPNDFYEEEGEARANGHDPHSSIQEAAA